MTTPNSARYAGPFQGNGSTTERTFTFPVLNKSVVKVVRAVLNEDTNVYEWGAPLTEGVDYTISLTAIPDGQTAYPGGTVTMTTAAADDEQDGIYSDEPGDNTAFNLEGQGPFAASAFNALADHVARAWLDMDRRLTQGANQSPFGTDPVIPDPTGAADGLAIVTQDEVYVLGAFQDFADWLITNVAAGRIIIGAGADSMTASERFKFLLASYTLYIKASSTASDYAVHIVDSDDNDILTFRADGVETADTDIARKLYVDEAISGFSVMAALITGFSAGAGTVANGDTLIQAINKICGNIDLKLATATAASTYVPLTSGSYTLARSNGLVTVGNTAAETALLSFTLPAGALATNRAVRIRCFGEWSHDGTNSIIVRMKYGASEVIYRTLDINAFGASSEPIWFDFEIRGNNSASAQVGTLLASYKDTGDAFDPNFRLAYGAGAENSANALTLQVTVEWGTGDSSDTLSMASEAVLV